MSKKIYYLFGTVIFLFLIIPFCVYALDLNLRQIIRPISVCPEGYECLTESEAYSKFNGNFEQYPDKICGDTVEKEFTVNKYCYKSSLKIEPVRELVVPENINITEPEAEPETDSETMDTPPVVEVTSPLVK